MMGGRGACCSRSAEPDSEVEELLPCFAIMRIAEDMIEAVVDTL